MDTKGFYLEENKVARIIRPNQKSRVTWSNQQNQLYKVRFVSENLSHMATNVCQ